MNGPFEVRGWSFVLPLSALLGEFGTSIFHGYNLLMDALTPNTRQRVDSRYSKNDFHVTHSAYYTFLGFLGYSHMSFSISLSLSFSLSAFLARTPFM